MAAWRWLVSPLLYAIYFVLTLAASNTSDLQGWHDLAWPMLREYLGTDLPPLEDASYWGLEERPFDVVRIKW